MKQKASVKNVVFICLSVIVGVIGFFFTIVAAVLEPQEGHSLVEVCCLSYFGVIVPVIALEVAKFLCFKDEHKKIYTVDVVGILICLFALIRLNLFYVGGMNFWDVWREEFFLYQFPWLIMLLVQVVLFILKSKKAKKQQ